MSTNGTQLPEPPLLDVASALAPTTSPGAMMGSDLAAPFTPLGVTPGALPILVRMPDGERRQIELPPTATVRDLRNALPDDSHWGDVSFNGQAMDDDSTLANYNIPDAYGHAGGLLKMISDSGNLDNKQKVEALSSACNIVATISRGETDMAALISAALDDPNAPAPGSPPPQPHIRSLRRGKRSFPSLNLDSLAPPELGRPPVVPPTPSQLIQRLSATRPDLYPPSAASRMLVTPNGKMEPDFGMQSGALDGFPASPPQPMENGDVKRTPSNTWFAEYARNITPFPRAGEEAEKQQPPAADIGNSEDDDPTDTNGAQAVQLQQQPASTYSAATDSHGADSIGGSTTGAEDQAAPPANDMRDTSQPAPSIPAQSTAGGATEVPDAPPVPAAPQPKKRGRKRKNPELSEEERKLLRQAQNRASAKQSRMRRKVMAAEYEKRVNTLEGENESLRDTIAALSDRLQFLQTLLTVSVQKRPPGPPPM